MSTTPVAPSNADFQAAIEAGTNWGQEVPVKEPEKKEPEPETEEVKTPEAAQEPAETSTDAKEQPEEDKTPIPARAQKRIDKEIDRAVSARKEAEDILAKLKAQAGQGSEPVKKTDPPKAEGKPQRPVRPQPGDETWGEYSAKLMKYEEEALPAYEEALLAWNSEQTIKTFEQRQTAAQQQGETAKVWEQAIKDHGADFPRIVERVRAEMPDSLQVAMSQFENWPAMAAKLDGDAGSIKDLVQAFKANPTLGIAQIAILSNSLKKPSKPAKAADPLPEPPEKVGGESSPGSGLSLKEKLEKASMSEFKKLMEKQLK